MLIEVPDHVYIIKAEGTSYFKIGRTTNIESRIIALSTGSPLALLPLGFYHVKDAVKIEMFLHYQLRRYQTRNEWFDLPQNVLDEVVRNLQAIKLPCDCSTYCMGGESTISQEFEQLMGQEPSKSILVEHVNMDVDRTRLEGVALSAPNELVAIGLPNPERIPYAKS